MDNLIVIAVDSLSEKVLSEYPFKEDLYIFNTLYKRAYVYTHFYSQGPYTEASVNGLICGQRGLDCGSFMYGYSKCPETIYSHFEKKGYKVYKVGASNELNEYCGEPEYHPSYISNCQNNRLRHFAELSKVKPLIPEQFECCKSLVLGALKKTARFCKRVIANDPAAELLNGYLRLEEVEALLSFCNKKIEAFSDCPSKELFNVLVCDNGLKPPNLKPFIPSYPTKAFAKLYRRFRKPILREITKHWLRPKKRGARNLIKALIKSIRACSPFYFFQWISPAYSYLKSYRRHLSVFSLEEKPAPSIKRRVDQAICQIQNTQDKPFFIYMQPEDFHSISAFHSHDIADIECVRAELSKALYLAKKIPADRVCNIANYLSIQYIDGELRRLFSFLEESGLSKNTKIVLTADHGSWDYCDAHHPDSLVLTEERIHIPLLFCDLALNKTSFHHEMRNSYDFPNLLLSFMGFPLSKTFAHEMPTVEGPLIAENTGFGCPDVFNLPLQYTVHDLHFKLVVAGRLDSALLNESCLCLFDLDQDPKEEENVLLDERYLPIKISFLRLANARHNALRKQIGLDYYQAPKDWLV